MDPRLLGLLVCPRCRGELDAEPARRTDPPCAVELVCRACRTRWPVVDGVPWLVEEFARRDPDPR